MYGEVSITPLGMATGLCPGTSIIITSALNDNHWTRLTRVLFFAAVANRRQIAGFVNNALTLFISCLTLLRS